MELLGNKVCVDNLRKDLDDVHQVLGNLTSRLGPVNFTSWKFPDKLSTEIDIADFLDMCEYDKNFPEENKISHLMLLELIVDRYEHLHCARICHFCAKNSFKIPIACCLYMI